MDARSVHATLEQVRGIAILSVREDSNRGVALAS